MDGPYVIFVVKINFTDNQDILSTHKPFQEASQSDSDPIHKDTHCQHTLEMVEERLAVPVLN